MDLAGHQKQPEILENQSDKELISPTSTEKVKARSV